MHGRPAVVRVKILGVGCPRCRRLEALVRQVVMESVLSAEVETVTDLGEFARYGILRVPWLVIGDTVVSAGRIPSRDQLATWLGTVTTIGAPAVPQISRVTPQRGDWLAALISALLPLAAKLGIRRKSPGPSGERSQGTQLIS